MREMIGILRGNLISQDHEKQANPVCRKGHVKENCLNIMCMVAVYTNVVLV
jgi:hypothetical protein